MYWSSIYPLPHHPIPIPSENTGDIDSILVAFLEKSKLDCLLTKTSFAIAAQSPLMYKIVFLVYKIQREKKSNSSIFFLLNPKGIFLPQSHSL